SEKEIKIIIQSWIRVLNLKLGWTNDISKIVAKYVTLLYCLVFNFNAIFAPITDIDKIMSCLCDKTIRLWDVKSGKELAKLEGHSNIVVDANFSPDGKNIVSYSFDRTIRQWGVNVRKEIKKWIGHSSYIRTVKFSLNDQMILSSSDDQTIGLLSATTGKTLRQLTGHSGIAEKKIEEYNNLKDRKYFSDSQTIISCSADKVIQLWNVKVEYEIQKLEGHSNVDISSDGCTIKAVSQNNKYIIDTSAKKTNKKQQQNITK
ncbi:hypothetical protein RFI_27412, partial [Reticulomyxa filosa]